MKPAGFSKAWPEKTRSVSLWPGLAGLKACRLSAGRPGRLRTLAWAGLGFCGSRRGRTVGRSPASEAYLTGPGQTADIYRLSSDKM